MNCGNFHSEKVGLNCPFCTIRVLVKALREMTKYANLEEQARNDAALGIASDTMRASRETL